MTTNLEKFISDMNQEIQEQYEEILEQRFIDVAKKWWNGKALALLAEIEKEVEKLPTMYPDDALLLKKDILALLHPSEPKED